MPLIAERAPLETQRSASGDARRQGRRYESLDAIRGVAALSVIFFHVTWPSHLTSTNFAHNCYTAVDLFFILSGFVIAASSEKKVQSGGALSSFFIRRFFRVYPLHLAIVAFLVALECVKLVSQLRGGGLGAHDAFTGAKSIPLLIANLAFVQGTGVAPHTSWNPPSWTVSAEFVAYLIFGVAGYFGLLRTRLFVPIWAMCGVIAYAWLALTHDSLDLTFDLGIVRCLSGFPIGIALYRLSSDPRMIRVGYSASTLLEITSFIVVCALLAFGQGATIVFIVPAYMFLLLVFADEGGAVSRLLRARYFQLLGLISYSIYLAHVPIRDLLMNIAKAAGAPTTMVASDRVFLALSPAMGDLLLLLFLIVSIAVAGLAYRYIEHPARDFGRRMASPARSPR